MKILKRMTVALMTLGLLAGCSGGSGTASEDSISEEAKNLGEITIYFTRHGKTMLNTTERAQGWADAPLTPEGIEVAEAVGRGIGDTVTFDKVYSSDSGRAIETTELILKNADQELPIEKDQRLREYNFGTFEGGPSGEMVAAICKEKNLSPEEYLQSIAKDGIAEMTRQMSNDLAEVDKKNIEGNENWPAEDYGTVAKRAKSALDDIVADANKDGDDSILIVSHGMTLATLLNELDSSAGSKIPMTGLENASISKATYKDGKWKVETVNDMSYAEKGAKE